MRNEAPFAVDAALLLLDIGRPDEALLKLREGFDITDPWCWYARAAALLTLDRYGDCIEAAQEGLALDPEHLRLLDVLAAARMQRSNLAGAEEAILTALNIDAEDAGLLTRYAHIVAQAGQLEKAEKLVARALAVDPENHYALQLHALLATAAGDAGAAMTRSRELLRQSPESPLAHRVMGAIQADRGRVVDAEHAFTNAVRLDPSHHPTAQAARELRMYRHPLLWPLRPVLRIGAVPLWIGAVVTILILRALNLNTAGGWFAGAWILYCVYTWVAPPAVRWLVRRR